MSGEITLTVVGNLTADPEHRLLPSGQVVANLTIAQNARTYDRASNEWRDGAAVFMRCVVWGEMGDHAAACLTRGMRVMATGRLRQRSYENRDGVTQWITELMVDDIAPSLKFATANVAVPERADAEPADPGDPHTSAPAAKKGAAKQKSSRPLVHSGAGDRPDF